MNHTKGPDPDKKITDLSRFLVSVPVAVAGVFIFIIGVIIGLLNPSNNFVQSTIGIIIANLGALLALDISVSLFTAPVQRNFANEVLNKISLSENLRTAGIKEILMQPRDIQWEDLFRKSKEVSLFFVTNHTWRNINLVHIEAFVKRKGNKLTVILPDPDNSTVVQELANRLKRTPERCREEINKARSAYHQLAKLSDSTSGGGADVNRRIASVMPMYSFYIFDETAIIVFQSYQDYKGDVPHIVSQKGGPLYEFIDREFTTLNSEKSDRDEFQAV